MPKPEDAIDHAAMRGVLAEIGRVPVERVKPQSRLGDIGLGSSLTAGVLRARFERQFGVVIADVTWRTTVAEILALTPGPPNAAPMNAAPAIADRPAPRAAMPALSVGLDMQEISALPENRSDAFYSAHFTAAEIAASSARADWRAHLCGVWCAKEAAKKAVPALMSAPFAAIEVTHDADGRPALRLPIAAGSISVSITHTATAAAAVVIIT